MGLVAKIRYVGLDFDSCICDVNLPFWTFFHVVKELENNNHPFHKQIKAQWIRILAREIVEDRCGLIRPEMIRFLRRLRVDTIFLNQPTIFVYTNNQSHEIVQLMKDILSLILDGKDPWFFAFHPQDPRRQTEFTLELGLKPKTFQGINACLDFPYDLTQESLLFLDDQEHPLLHDLGSNYIHVPGYVNPDSLLFYLRTLTLAMFTVVPTFPERVRFFETVGSCLGIDGQDICIESDERIRIFLKECEEADAAFPRPSQPFHDTLLAQVERYFQS